MGEGQERGNDVQRVAAEGLAALRNLKEHQS